VLRASGVRPGDRVFFAFSFAPFIGFWSAYHGVSMLGAMAIAGGGMDSRRRLGLLAETGATVLLCTPTYALHLAEVGRKEGVSTANSSVRLTIHAGEPGGSVPAVRQRISEAWGAEVFDHAGASEIGAFGTPDCEGRGVVLNEAEFIAEVIDPASGEPRGKEAEGELVLTNLGRVGWPVVRYRTGDIVRARRLADGRLLLEGGVLGRADEMITVRGVNVYPAAIENIIRRRAESGELRITARRAGEMDEISIELEADAATCRAVGEEIHDQIGLRASVVQAAEGSLPRFELKARRFRDLRR
jgi:phenylacetate-CoA ligase